MQILPNRHKTIYNMNETLSDFSSVKIAQSHQAANSTKSVTVRCCQCSYEDANLVIISSYQRRSGPDINHKSLRLSGFNV